VQLQHTVDPDLLFRKYWYRSRINETMCAELKDIVEQARARVDLQAGDHVMDIGANDGTLLANYPLGINRVAFEPAENLYQELYPHAELIVRDYFPVGARWLNSQRARVKIITSIACFYDADDPRAFVDAIRDFLHPDGIWIVQFQDWDQMQKIAAFDNICHEHLVYYTLASFQRLIEPLGLVVVDAEERPINGGSYRLYIRHKGAEVDGRRISLLHIRERNAEDWQTFPRFAYRAGEVRRQIRAIVSRYGVLHGKTIDVYGASTKFNTLAQWCDVTGDVIRYAWERDQAKWGLQTVTKIPIIDETIGRDEPPAALLVGIWQFRDAILRREAEYLRRGGSMIFPLPKVEIVSERAVTT
jgi:hypothetical protein